MRKTFATAAAVVLAAALAPAQDAKTAPVGSPKIAVIDGQRVFAESTLGKSYAQQLEKLQVDIRAEGNKKQADLEKLDAALKALQEELEKQGAVLSDEAKERKRQEIVKKGRERQAFLEDGQAELQRLRERAEQQAQAMQREFQGKVQPLVEAVAKERGVDIILDSQVAVVVNKAFDLTQDVIARANTLPPAGTPAPAGSPKP